MLARWIAQTIRAARLHRVLFDLIGIALVIAGTVLVVTSSDQSPAGRLPHPAHAIGPENRAEGLLLGIGGITGNG